MKIRRLALAATLLSSGAVATAQTSFEGAGQQSRIDCDGGSAHVTGAGNEVTVDGPCELLVVQGSSNIVTVDLAAKSAIRVQGASNRISWRAPEKARPRISSSGADNSIRRVR